jgi:hypothetical protein
MDVASLVETKLSLERAIHVGMKEHQCLLEIEFGGRPPKNAPNERGLFLAVLLGPQFNREAAMPSYDFYRRQTFGRRVGICLARRNQTSACLND